MLTSSNTPCDTRSDAKKKPSPLTSPSGAKSRCSFSFDHQQESRKADIPDPTATLLLPPTNLVDTIQTWEM
jgi:hypothetical protein